MLKKMAMNIGGVSFVLSAMLVLSSLSNILLARVLSAEDMGKFALLRTLILFIPPLAIWGQDIAAARYFSQHDAGQFRWDKAFHKILLVSAALVGIGVVIAQFIYHLSTGYLAGVFVASLCYCAILLYSNLVRSRQRYNQSILLAYAFRGLFFIFLVTVYLTTKITLFSAAGAFIEVLGVAAILNVWYSYHSVPRGKDPVPLEMHKTGIVLMGIEASVDFMASLDSLFMPKLLGFEALGLYAATLVPAQVFNVLARASKYVWVPEFGRSKQLRFKLLNIVVGVVALVLLVGVVVAAKPILHLLYGGKYDDGATLLRVLALVGVFRLFYGLSSSVIVGRMGTTALNYHLAITFATLILYVGILYSMLQRFGVIGAGWALLILTGLRMVGSYWVVYKFRHQVKAPSAAENAPMQNGLRQAY